MSGAGASLGNPPPHDLRAWLALGAQRLREAGIDRSRREAALLLADLVDATPAAVLVGHARAPAPDAGRAYLERVARRVRRVPLQQVLGTTPFHDVVVRSPPGVLVPRPETEGLVRTALELLADRAAPTVLDLGSGSGAVAVAIAAARRDARVVAIDVCPDATRCTRESARALGVADRVRVLRADWLAALAPAARFDAVVANPPYVATDRIATLAPEVRDHDPRRALDGGPDGLACYRALVPGAVARLAAHGWLALEIGADQGEVVRTLVAAAGGSSPRVLADLAGRPRYVVAGAPSPASHARPRAEPWTSW